MSKQNGFYCDNPEHRHVTESEAIECYGRTKIGDMKAVIEPHITDLINTANVLEEWQDPMVGPFDGTIAELRKAAAELLHVTI